MRRGPLTWACSTAQCSFLLLSTQLLIQPPHTTHLTPLPAACPAAAHLQVHAHVCAHGGEDAEQRRLHGGPRKAHLAAGVPRAQRRRRRRQRRRRQQGLLSGSGGGGAPAAWQLALSARQGLERRQSAQQASRKGGLLLRRTVLYCDVYAGSGLGQPGRLLDRSLFHVTFLPSSWHPFDASSCLLGVCMLHTCVCIWHVTLLSLPELAEEQ